MHETDDSISQTPNAASHVGLPAAARDYVDGCGVARGLQGRGSLSLASLSSWGPGQPMPLSNPATSRCHVDQIPGLQASNPRCKCCNGVQSALIHGTVELQVATMPRRWRLVYRRATR